MLYYFLYNSFDYQIYKNMIIFTAELTYDNLYSRILLYKNSPFRSTRKPHTLKGSNTRISQRTTTLISSFSVSNQVKGSSGHSIMDRMKRTREEEEDGGPSAAQEMLERVSLSVDEREYRACQVISRFLRNYSLFKTEKLVKDFNESGPTLERVQAISFEDLVLFLRNRKTISVTRACLQRVHLASTFLHRPIEDRSVPDNVNVRFFLSSYMVVYGTTHVFEHMGPLESALLKAATPLLRSFHAIIEAIGNSTTHSLSSVPKELTRDFPNQLLEYLERFNAWKVPDGIKLSRRIKHALLALYRANDIIPPTEPVNSNLRLEFSNQIKRLRTKLSRISGPAALEQFDSDRQANGSGGGGGAGGSSGADEADGADGSDEADGAGGCCVSGTGGGAGNPEGWMRAVWTTKHSPLRLTNEQLAHELLMDMAFQLHDGVNNNDNDPILHRIRESFNESFWDSLVDDLRLDTPCYVRVLRVLTEIRDAVVELPGAQNARNISHTISEAIDIEFISEQIEKKAYDWQACVRLVTGIFNIVKQVLFNPHSHALSLTLNCQHAILYRVDG